MAPAKSLNELSDEELVSQVVQKGDRMAFGELYNRHHLSILHKATGIVRDVALAEDLTHDIFLKLFFNLNKFRPTYKFVTWFNVFSYNFILDHLRKNKKYNSMKSDIDDTQLEFDPEEEAREEKRLFEIEVEKLEVLMAKLTEADRTLLLMKYRDDMKVEQIAELLKIGKSAVKMRLKRSREKILELYQNQYQSV